MKRIHSGSVAIYRHADKLGRAVYYVDHPTKRRISHESAIALADADVRGILKQSMIRKATQKETTK